MHPLSSHDNYITNLNSLFFPGRYLPSGPVRSAVFVIEPSGTWEHGGASPPGLLLLLFAGSLLLRACDPQVS